MLHVGVGDWLVHLSLPASSLALRLSCLSLTGPSASFTSALLLGLPLQVYRLKLSIFEALHLPVFFYRVRNACLGSAMWEAAAPGGCRAAGLGGGPGSSRGEGEAQPLPPCRGFRCTFQTVQR